MTTLSFDNVVKCLAPSVPAGQFKGGELFMNDRKFGFPNRQQTWRVVAMTAIVMIVALPEDQLRQQVTQDVAANSGRYDLFTIGTYEVPLWAKKGWIENLSPYIAKDPSYAPDDLIPGIKGALS